jgi:hypothetical protein
MKEAANGGLYAGIIGLSWPASNCRSTIAACVHVSARSSKPCRSSFVLAREAERIASSAYCQNSPVFNMTLSRCPDTSPVLGYRRGQWPLFKIAHLGRWPQIHPQRSLAPVASYFFLGCGCCCCCATGWGNAAGCVVTMRVRRSNCSAWAIVSLASLSSSLALV